MSPLVSILIPSYNAERWVAQAIESALAQTWPSKEIIVIDDGSTDGSLDVITSFGDCIRWEASTNQGGGAARNRLLELAQGEWVQYLDADDYLLPEKIAGQMDFLTSQPETDVVFGLIIKENWTGDGVSQEVQSIPDSLDLWVLLARWYLPQTGSPLWRRQALLDVGGWKVGQPCCQEHELYLRLLIGGKRFAYCTHHGAIYRQWSNETVCTKNVPEVHRYRLEIEQQMEEFLALSNQLTPQRQWAINQARFEIARIAWHYNPTLASEIMGQVRQRHPEFIPGGVAAPEHYRLFYRLLGFESAEKLALLKRRWLYGGRLRPKASPPMSGT